MIGFKTSVFLDSPIICLPSIWIDRRRRALFACLVGGNDLEEKKVNISIIIKFTKTRIKAIYKAKLKLHSTRSGVRYVNYIFYGKPDDSGTAGHG